jgi:hypothetical protein
LKFAVRHAEAGFDTSLSPRRKRQAEVLGKISAADARSVAVNKPSMASNIPLRIQSSRIAIIALPGYHSGIFARK